MLLLLLLLWLLFLSLESYLFPFLFKHSLPRHALSTKLIIVENNMQFHSAHTHSCTYAGCEIYNKISYAPFVWIFALFTKTNLYNVMNNVGNSIYGHRFTCFCYIRQTMNLYLYGVGANIKFYVAFLNFTIESCIVFN